MVEEMLHVQWSAIHEWYRDDDRLRNLADTLHAFGRQQGYTPAELLRAALAVQLFHRPDILAEIKKEAN